MTTKAKIGYWSCMGFCIAYAVLATVATITGDQVAFDRTLVQSSIFLADAFIINALS